MITIGITAAIHAQQKPSERSLAGEIQKVQEKKAQRLRMLRQQQQSTDTLSTTAPIIPAPATGKPSTRPMVAPVRPKRQTQ